MKLDTKCGGGFEKYSVAWFDEYCIEFIGRIYRLNVGHPAPEGRYSPEGGVVEKWFYKLDTKLLGWV